MFRKLTAALSISSFLIFLLVPAASNAAQKLQVIRLERFRKALWTIETPASLAKRTKTMKELPFRISRECSARCLSVFVGVPTAQGMTWLILDSGAGGVSLISKDHARLFGLDPEGKEQRLKYEVAPGVPIDSPVVVTDMIMDGNLGQPFMKEYVITFDLAHGRMWLAKAAGLSSKQDRE